MATKKLHQGPRTAGWSIYVIDGEGRPKRCVVSVGSAADAIRDAEYYIRECGYKVEIVRTEFCTVPGCEGHWANIKTRGKRGFYKDAPCPTHVEPIDTIAIPVTGIDGSVVCYAVQTGAQAIQYFDTLAEAVQ
jgi:hypothetical protein